MEMDSEAKTGPHEKLNGRVVLHVVLTIVFAGLCYCVTSRDYYYLAAYIPPLLLLPFMALAIMVISLALTFWTKNGKSLHQACSLAISVVLYLTSLSVWKRSFEYGQTASPDALVMLVLSGCVAIGTAVSWLLRREKITFSIRQLAALTLFLSVVLAVSQQILRLDKMSSYEREIDAVRDLERAGIQVIRDDWSVSEVAIRNAGIRDEQLERICEFRNLQSLSLEGNPITDATLAAISNVAELHSIYLTDTNVGDAGLAHLADARNLEQLWLGGTKITDNGLASLDKLKSLSYVDLSDTNITDGGLEKLTHLKRMYYLHLPGTRVTRLGMETLGEALPDCNIYGTPNGTPYTVER